MNKLLELELEIVRLLNDKHNITAYDEGGGIIFDDTRQTYFGFSAESSDFWQWSHCDDNGDNFVGGCLPFPKDFKDKITRCKRAPVV